MNHVLWLVIILMLPGACDQDDLAWSDEFNYQGAPDSTLWDYDLGTGHNGWGNNEMQIYTRDPRNVWVADGRLWIVARREADGRWTSARLVSRDKNHVKYGRIQFRARLPKGIGTWPALWMLGENISDVGWPACGEIDVMEHVGKNHGQVHSALHMPASYGQTFATGVTQLGRPDTTFHVYEVNWTPDSIAFSVDGTNHYTYIPETKDKANWPFDTPHYLLMNIAMGGNWGSHDPLETNGLQNGIDPDLEQVAMEVDYVRVFKE
jgi:beta-glucanase (GH16 family)